ncbi:MAG: glycosyltransferase family 39 protein [Elusimicrobiota bacterium]
MNLRYFALSFIILVSIFINLAGSDWGIPGETRKDLVMPKELDNAAFYNFMVSARNDIYENSGNSPLGRVKKDASGPADLTPIMKTMGVKTRENPVFYRNRTALSNFIRPYLLRSCHTDEQMTIASLGGMRPEKLDFNPRIFQYGGAYIYSVGAWFACLKLAGILKLTTDLSFYFQNPVEMGKFFTAGRIMNSIFTSLSILMLFIICKRFFTETAGLIAALFFTLLPAVVIQQHIMKPYCMGTFFALSCLYFSILLSESGESMKYYVLSGACLGLTVASMPFYGLIAAAPLTVFAAGGRFKVKNIALFTVSALSVFALTNPYWILDYKGLLSEVVSFTAVKGSGSGKFSDFIYYIFRQIPSGAPAGIILSFLGGIALFSAKPGKKERIILISGVIPLLLSAWIWRSHNISIHNTRVLLPWLAILCIPSAVMFERLLSKNRVFAVSLVLLAAVTFQLSAASAVCVRNLINDTYRDSSRVTAGKWINENLPYGSSIGVFYFPEPSHVPPFNFINYRLTVILNRDTFSNGPEYIIQTGKSDAETNAFLEANKYALLRTFSRGAGIMGYSHDIGMSHINPGIRIFKRS